MSRWDGTAPIHRCPPELLSTIFTMSLPPFRYGLLDESIKSSRTLSQVCFRWRDLALSVSCLWNHITLSRWSHNRIEWIEELSRRSRQVPISLHVGVGGLGWDTEDSVLYDTRLSRLLKELMPRTRVLEVRLDCTLLANQCAPNLMQTLRNHAVPLLESFHLTPFNNQRTTDYSPLDFFFNGQAPKLTSLRFNIHFSALHSSILLNVTTFYLADGSTFTDPNFTWKKCLDLLKAMPSLENLLLTVELAPDMTGHDEDVEEIHLSNLKHLRMQSTCQDCASLLKWIIFSPGCTFDITSTDTEMNQWCYDLLQALEHCIMESEISATSDYILDIQVSDGFLRLLVCPPFEKKPIYFVFSSWINTIHEEEEEEEGNVVDPSSDLNINSDLYEHLFLFTRMIHRTDLPSQVSEIRLAVNVILPLEICTAAVFGSLVRACKQAKRVVLTGSENIFVLPILFDFMEAMEKTFDAFFRRELSLASSASSSSDSNFDSDSDFDLFPTKTKRKTPSLPSTINFLHTDFDVSTLLDKHHFMHLVIWYQAMSRLVRDIFWPVPVLRLSSSIHDSGEELTMRDVMNYYLKPVADLV